MFNGKKEPSSSSSSNNSNNTTIEGNQDTPNQPFTGIYGNSSLVKFSQFSFKIHLKEKATLPDKEPEAIINEPVNPISYFLFQLLGINYTKETVYYMLPKLFYIREHLKTGKYLAQIDEILNPTKEKTYFEYSNGFDHDFRRNWSKIVKYYTNIIEYETEALLKYFTEEFDKNVLYSFTENEKDNKKVFTHDHEKLFIGSDLDKVRTESFIVIYELFSRYCDILALETDKNIIPDEKYLENFFGVLYTTVSAGNVYIFLKNNRSILVYDLKRHLKSETTDKNVYTNTIFPIDLDRNIYILHFNEKITEVEDNDRNILIKTESGKIYINGYDDGYKLPIIDHNYDNENDPRAIVNFLYYTDSTNLRKLINYKDTVFVVRSEYVEIIGKVPYTIRNYVTNKENADGTGYHKWYTDIAITDLYVVDGEETTVLLCVDQEKHIYFYGNGHDALKHQLDLGDFDKIKQILLFRFNIIVLYTNNEVISFNFLQETKETIDNSETSGNITKLIPVETDSFIAETVFNSKFGIIYNYYAHGDNSNYRFGIKDETYLDTLNFLINLSNYEVDVETSIKIKQVVSYHNRIMILLENGILMGCGNNGGYFTLKNTSEDDFSKFVTLRTVEEPIDSFSTNAEDRHSRPLVTFKIHESVICSGINCIYGKDVYGNNEAHVDDFGYYDEYDEVGGEEWQSYYAYNDFLKDINYAFNSFYTINTGTPPSLVTKDIYTLEQLKRTILLFHNDETVTLFNTIKYLSRDLVDRYSGNKLSLANKIQFNNFNIYANINYFLEVYIQSVINNEELTELTSFDVSLLQFANLLAMLAENKYAIINLNTIELTKYKQICDVNIPSITFYESLKHSSLVNKFRTLSLWTGLGLSDYPKN
jgi:hypothetical protein